MTAVLELRRGNTAAVVAATPRDGELFVNTDDYKARVGDGATVGGLPLDGHEVVTVSTTSHTTAPSDQGKMLVTTNGGATGISLPQALAANNFGNGAQIWVFVSGAGTVTITPTTSTINGAATLVLATSEGAMIVSDGANYFAIHSASSSGASFGSLSDVNFTSLANNDFVAYDSGSSKWTNRTPTASTALLVNMIGDTGTGGVKGLVPAPASGDAAAGKFLKADGAWTALAGNSTLAGDTDVNISSPANNDFFEYQTSDSKWHNRTPTQVTAALDVLVGDTGTGGTKGLAPAPASGDAAAGKFLKADATYAVPPGLFGTVLSSPVPTSANTGLTTWANQGGSTTVGDGATGVVLHDVSNGNAENSRLRYKTTLPGTPYTVKALIACANDLANNHHAVTFFGWYDGTKIQAIGIHASSGLLFTLDTILKTNVTTDGGSTGLAVGISGMIWVAANDTGSAVHLAYSFDGANYVRIYDQTYAGSFLGAAPTRIVFGINPYGSAMYGTLMSYQEVTGNLP